VRKGAELVAELNPSLALYHRSDKRTSEVDIRRTLAGDLYVALVEVDRSGQLINLKVLLKPFINWVWIGASVMALGTALVLFSYYRVLARTSKAQGEDMR